MEDTSKVLDQAKSPRKYLIILLAILCVVFAFTALFYWYKLSITKSIVMEQSSNAVPNNPTSNTNNTSNVPVASSKNTANFADFMTALGGQEITQAEFESRVNKSAFRINALNEVFPYNPQLNQSEREKIAIENTGGGKVLRDGNCLVFSNGSTKKDICNQKEVDDKGNVDYEYLGTIMDKGKFFLIQESGYEYGGAFLIDQKTLERKETIGFSKFIFPTDYSKLILSYDSTPLYSNGEIQIFFTNPWKIFPHSFSEDPYRQSVSLPWNITKTFWVNPNEVYIQFEYGDTGNGDDIIATRYGMISFPN